MPTVHFSIRKGSRTIPGISQVGAFIGREWACGLWVASPYGAK